MTIAIISYNSNPTLGRCLDSLAAQSFKDFRVILIDNASEEKPQDLLSTAQPPVHFIQNAENVGFAPAMNQALALTESPFFVALNPDAYPEPHWLETLVQAAEQHADVAAFGSLQRKADSPDVIDGYGDGYLIFGQAWRGTAPPPDQEGPHESFSVCAAAALYRTALLKEIGGYYEACFCFYEDVDLAFRLRLAGHRLVNVPNAVVEHVGGASFEDRSDFADHLIARNQYWVLLRNMPWAILPASLLGFFALNVIGALRHSGSSRIKGLKEGLIATAHIIEERKEIQKSRCVSTGEILRWLHLNPRAFFQKRSPVKGR